MGKYERIDKDKIIRFCDRVQELEDMQYHYDPYSGDIIPTPDGKRDEDICGLLLDAYALLGDIEEEIKKDYASLQPYSISLDKEERFITSAQKLLDTYHLKVPDRDFGELKKYFKPEFNNKWFDNSFAPRLNRKWNKKDCARIAYLIFRSKNRSAKNVGTVFSEFHRRFCEIVKGEYTAEYKPNKLESDMGAIPDEFRFL